MYSKRHLPDRSVEPEQWLQRHPEAGSSWPSWPKASQLRISVFALGARRVARARPVEAARVELAVGRSLPVWVSGLVDWKLPVYSGLQERSGPLKFNEDRKLRDARGM